MYWSPPATGPPTPSLNGVSIFASAPADAVEHDAGAHAHDAHAELLGARCASRSQATHTSARKSVPGGAASSTVSSPRGP